MRLITKQVNNKPLTVTIEYPELDVKTENLIKKIKSLDFIISGNYNGKTFAVNISDIYYMESVERKTFLYTKKEGKKDYFKRCFSFRYMGIKWLLLTILFFSVVTITALTIGVGILEYEMPDMNFIHAIIQNPFYIFLVLFFSVISGPLNEEFGWRGYALDRLFVRYGFVRSTLLLGFIWGIWHMAWYFTPGQSQYDMLQYSVLHAVMWIPETMIFNFSVSYVYVKTKRSILAGAMVHMFSNLLGSQLLSPYSPEISMNLRYSTMFFCGCLALYCIFSPKFKKEFNNLLQK